MFDEISLMATLNNPDQVDGALKMYASVGGRVTADTHGYEGIEIWNDGLGILLNKNNVKSGQTIKVLLQGTKYMNVNFQVYSVSDKRRVIKPKSKVYDFVS